MFYIEKRIKNIFFLVLIVAVIFTGFRFNRNNFKIENVKAESIEDTENSETIVTIDYDGGIDTIGRMQLTEVCSNGQTTVSLGAGSVTKEGYLIYKIINIETNEEYVALQGTYHLPVDSTKKTMNYKILWIQNATSAPSVSYTVQLDYDGGRVLEIRKIMRFLQLIKLR